LHLWSIQNVPCLSLQDKLINIITASVCCFTWTCKYIIMNCVTWMGLIIYAKSVSLFRINLLTNMMHVDPFFLERWSFLECQYIISMLAIAYSWSLLLPYPWPLVTGFPWGDWCPGLWWKWTSSFSVCFKRKKTRLPTPQEGWGHECSGTTFFSNNLPYIEVHSMTIFSFSEL